MSTRDMTFEEKIMNSIVINDPFFIEAQDGYLLIRNRARGVLAAFLPRFRIEDSLVCASELSSDGGGVFHFLHKYGLCRIRLMEGATPDWLEITMEFDNTTDSTLSLHEFRLDPVDSIPFATDAGNQVIYKNCVIMDGIPHDPYWTGVLKDGQEQVSSLYAGVHTVDRKRTAILGFVKCERQFPEIVLKREGDDLQVAFRSRGLLPVYPGESCSSGVMTIRFETINAKAMKDYASRIQHYYGLRDRLEEVSGWCSWYYYYGGVREEAINENLGWFSRRKKEFPIKLIQLDGGYAACSGDWLELNDKFSDMRLMAKGIAEAGFTPGIWVAPFMVNPKSRLLHEHPEWCVHNPDGSLAINPIWKYHILDGTHPGAVAYMRNVFRVFVKEWDFRYIKLDFLHDGICDGVRHDRWTNPVTSFRSFMQALRDEVGEQIFMCFCTTPYFASIGLADSARVTPDIQAQWLRPYEGFPGGVNDIYNASPEIYRRQFMNRKLWINDPDCLVVRSRAEEDNESGNTCTGDFSYNEAWAYAAMESLTGGCMIYSDKMRLLGSERLGIALKTLPPLSLTADVPDMFERLRPNLLRLPLEDGSMVISCLNWEDTPMSFTFDGNYLETPDDDFLVYEVWQGRFLGRVKDLKTMTIPGRTMYIFNLIREKIPFCFLGTDLHFCQSAGVSTTVHSDGAATIDTFIPKTGSIAFYMPQGRFCEQEGLTFLREGPVVKVSGRFNGKIFLNYSA